MKEKITKPSVLTAQEKQQYQKPEYQVIDINMESPLLAGSQGAGFNSIQRKKE
ncbi:MAG: hypothetical protein IKQ70_03555 [Bacteroidales bacterium]|nr:hypothetical protein [Bacteroidales bacterium]